ncbi:MAG TPA: Bax inhibitor-1/YccA family protein [Rugosimonospora sp.]|nr:Bax inhibitor-1/YccA family protein [Rugosimonospora sp.]
MRSSNPVLTRLGEAAEAERSTGYAPYPQVIQPGAGAARAMNIDDVVTRTVLLLLLTGAAGAVSWLTLRSGAFVGLAMLGSAIAGLVLGLVISFARVTNPIVISLYAVLQGVLLGVVSREFEQVYHGIVIQAAASTFGVFAGMAALYKLRVLRATPKFTRFVVGALFGLVALSLINWILAMFGHNLGYEYYGPTQHAGPVAILFSLAAIVIGALTFIIDFDMVEQGIRYGLPERYAWYCAFGLLVGLIFLYWQILRLLGYLRR